MKRLILFILIITQISYLQAQTKKRLSIEINYGLGGNFFVRSYDDYSPGNVVRFYKKNFIGTIGGAEVKYNLTSKSSLNIGYAHSINKREINYTNGINIGISYFNISHINEFYQLFYERAINKKKNFKIHSGIFYLRMHQQEVDASPSGIGLDERDFKHNKLEEGGAFLGFHFSKKIDTKFDLGIKSRVYYLISTNLFEAITLTPTLTYHF